MKIMCMKCRHATETTGAHESMAKNGRAMVKGNCAVCGCKKCQFVKGGVKKGAGFLDFLSDFGTKVALPIATQIAVKRLGGKIKRKRAKKLVM